MDTPAKQDVSSKENVSEQIMATEQPPLLTSPLSDKEEKNWALMAHLSSLSTYVGIPGFIGPLVIWLLKKDTMPFASEQAKEALNFQISLFIYGIICAVLTFTLIFAVIGIPGLMILAVLHVVFTIMATIQAGEGKSYRYPLTIPLIS